MNPEKEGHVREEAIEQSQDHEIENNSNPEDEYPHGWISLFSEYLTAKANLEYYQSLQAQGVKERQMGIISSNIESIENLIRRQQGRIEYIQSTFTESDMVRVKALEDLENNEEFQRLLKRDEDAFNLQVGHITSPGVLRENTLRLDESRKKNAIENSRSAINAFLQDYFKTHNIRQDIYPDDAYNQIVGRIKIK